MTEQKQLDLKIELNGKQLVPRELTINEIETLLGNLDDTIHPLEAMCPQEPVPAAAAMSVGVEVDALLDLVPSLVPELMRQVREKNPFLTFAVETLADVGRRLQVEGLKTSGAPSAD